MTHKGWCVVKNQTNKQNKQLFFAKKISLNSFTFVEWLIYAKFREN